MLKKNKRQRSVGAEHKMQILIFIQVVLAKMFQQFSGYIHV